MKLTNYLGKTDKTALSVGLGGGVACALSIRLAVGSPLPVMRLLGTRGLLPPLWLLSLLWLALYGLVGATVGCLLVRPPRGPWREAGLWRGATFLVLAVALSFGWYALLFGSFLLLSSWLCLLGAAVCGAAAALAWKRASPWGSVAVWMLSAWWGFLLISQLVVMLHN